MKYLLTAFLLALTINLPAQDSVICSCSRMFSIKYPSKAEESKISGKVIIEIDRDENCVLSNPVIRQGLGYGCEEEALRIVRLQIEFANYCTQKCVSKRNCSKSKITQIITFRLSDE